MVTKRRVKVVAGLVAVAATIIAVYLVVRHLRGESREEAIRHAEQLVSRGARPCQGAPGSSLAEPPTPEFFEGNRIYHRYIGTEHPDIVRGLGQQIQHSLTFTEARWQRIRNLSDEIWAAQSSCRGAFLLACSHAEGTTGSERSVRCEPWRAYARWLRDEIHFEMPVMSPGQCAGCAYLFE